MLMKLTAGVKDVLIPLAKYRTFRKMGFFFFLSYLFPRQCRKRLHTSVPQGLTLFLRKTFLTRISTQKLRHKKYIYQLVIIFFS